MLICFMHYVQVSRKSQIRFVKKGSTIYYSHLPAVHWLLLEPYCYMMKSMSKLPVFTEIPAELMCTGNPMITDRTVAILTSKSGDTKETVAVAKWLAERNVTTISLCGVENSPLAAVTTYSVTYGEAQPNDLCSMFIVGKIMYNRGEFDGYPKFADELANLGNVLVSVGSC